MIDLPPGQRLPPQKRAPRGRRRRDPLSKGLGQRGSAFVEERPRPAAGVSNQTASNRDPGSASKRDPSPALGQACPGSEQEGPARVAQCPHERRSGGAWEVPVCPPGQAGVALRRGA